MGTDKSAATTLPNCPSGLLRALEGLSAEVVRVTDHTPRFHVRLRSPIGPLFAWYSSDPADHAALRHELAVRDAIGRTGLLRTPDVYDHGESWRVERMVGSEPMHTAAVLELVVQAADVLAQLTLPAPPDAATSRSRLPRYGRMARLVLSPLSTRDVVAARRILRSSRLPRVTSHGEFHTKHVFVTDSAVWVIDWEGLGRRPLGFDLMQLLVSLDDAQAREVLFERALGVVGEPMETELRRLHYAALVQRAAAFLVVPRQFGDRDPETARVLLAQLPDVRAKALGRRVSRGSPRRWRSD